MPAHTACSHIHSKTDRSFTGLVYPQHSYYQQCSTSFYTTGHSWNQMNFIYRHFTFVSATLSLASLQLILLLITHGVTEAKYNQNTSGATKFHQIHSQLCQRSSDQTQTDRQTERFTHKQYLLLQRRQCQQTIHTRMTTNSICCHLTHLSATKASNKYTATLTAKVKGRKRWW